MIHLYQCAKKRFSSMTKPTRSIVIGTAGHINHGKTTLVRALTGVDTDRLPEEKRRGITIDLGFAFLDAAGPDDSSWRMSFVDVPGHSFFIRNMLAGAGCIDAVLLVISAEEGVKPQTEEHLTICTLLGIRRGLTVVTKADAVSTARLEQVCSDVRTFLSDTFLGESNARVLPVSVHTGQGLNKLRRELLSLAMSATARNPDHLPRLPLDRAFVMKGFGTVVTGTLLSGELHVGESLTLEPGSRTVRVRGMQAHGGSEERVESGSRVALNLSGIEVAEVSRGQTLVSEGTLTSTTVIDVDATLLAGSSVVKHRSRVRFHAFTSDTLATVSLYGHEAAEPGTRRLMRLRLQQPIVLVPGDHFVLRQCSPGSTIGGGRVLDAHPLPNLRKANCLAWLQRLNDASHEEQLLLRVTRRAIAGLTVHELMAETGLTRDALERCTEPFVSSKQLLRIPGDMLLSNESAETASSDISSRLKMEAKSDGLKRSELRSQTGLNAAILNFLIEKQVREQKIRLQDEHIYPIGSQLQGADPDLKQRSAIAAIYEAAGLAAPSSSEVATKLGLKDSEMRRLMTLLLRDRILVKIGMDALYIHKGALERLRDRMRELRGQTLDVTGFKQLTGLSRKYAIPLLEQLDRERLTRKNGDKRLVL
jgi:selenocysteine-specific elongation factor